jgi:hypothetical protein
VKTTAEEATTATVVAKEAAIGGHKMHIFIGNIPIFHSRYRR